MIKVNLLRDQTVRVRKTVPKPTVSRMMLLFIALFLLLAGGMGAWWYHLDLQVKVLTESRDKLRIEYARLEALKKEIDRFEKMKQLRQSRIDVIERLKENQKGPVLLLNDVIDSIPSNGPLWLTALDQKEDRIKIVGYARHNEAVADFMSNLSATGFFKSVDLELLESEKDASKFSLLCTSMRKQQSE